MNPSKSLQKASFMFQGWCTGSALPVNHAENLGPTIILCFPGPWGIWTRLINNFLKDAVNNYLIFRELPAKVDYTFETVKNPVESMELRTAARQRRYSLLRKLAFTVAVVIVFLIFLVIIGYIV